MLVNPYLQFNGNAEEVFSFYKSVFGGEFAAVQRFKDLPASENAEGISTEEGNKIMHIALNIGTTMLMGTDIPAERGRVQAGNNFSLCINVDTKEDADRIFKGLSEGGNVEMPMRDTFWGDYFGMLIDQYQTQWMISYNPNFNGNIN